jgi:hypothetical protein
VDAQILEHALSQEQPYVYEYALTEKGLDLLPVIVADPAPSTLWPSPQAWRHLRCMRRPAPFGGRRLPAAVSSHSQPDAKHARSAGLRGRIPWKGAFSHFPRLRPLPSKRERGPPEHSSCSAAHAMPPIPPVGPAVCGNCATWGCRLPARQAAALSQACEGAKQ